jgi:hypothetical protein
MKTKNVIIVAVLVLSATHATVFYLGSTVASSELDITRQELDEEKAKLARQSARLDERELRVRQDQELVMARLAEQEEAVRSAQIVRAELNICLEANDLEDLSLYCDKYIEDDYYAIFRRNIDLVQDFVGGESLWEEYCEGSGSWAPDQGEYDGARRAR